MSLLLHYPLNGDLTNKGILNKCELVQNLSDNQVGFVNGKLGKSAWFDTVANRYLKTSYSCNQILEDGSPFTLAAWFYLDNHPIDYSHKTGIVGCNNWRGKGIGIGVLETGKIVFHYHSSTESKELSSTMNVVAGEWCHVACTYDGSIMRTYINGVLDSTWTTTFSWETATVPFRIGGLPQGGWSSYTFPGSINDVRVYDEALSVESIKELNRCLLLHYSFNDPAVESTVNLLHNETIVFGGLTSNVSYSTVGNKTLLTVSPKENYSYGSFRISIPLSVLTTGVQYAFSFKYRVISESGYLIPNDWCDIGLSEATRKVAHIDDYFLWEVSCPTGRTYSSTYRFLDISCEREAAEYEIWDIQLEERTWPSPFVDGTRISVVCDDCGNNYPLSNNMVGFSENSPIGLRSAHFSDATSYQCLYNTDTIFYEIPSFTFSGWVNFSSVREYGTILSISKPAYSGYPLWIFMGTDRKVKVSAYTSTISRNTSATAVPYNTWTHIAVSAVKGGEVKIYINGVLDSTSSTDSVSWNGNDNYVYLGDLRLNRRCTLTGFLADIRLYGSVLTEEEVKALYNIKAKITNQGEIFANYFQEKQNLSFGENINYAIIKKELVDGLYRFQQTNCQITLTDHGYRIYRTPNIVNDKNYGGFVVKFNSYIYKYLIPGHTYSISYNISGVNDSTAGSSTSILPIGWTGWGNGSSAGVNNQAVVLKNTCNIPPGFVGSRKCEFVFTIPSNDVLYKTATVTTGPVVAGQEYLSYGEFSSTWTYSTTGEKGTDIYITNFKMMDITSAEQPQIKATAVFEGDYFNETHESASFSKYGEIRAIKIKEV